MALLPSSLDMTDKDFERDEALFSTTGQVKHPRVGAVYYPIDHDVEGGYLRIFSGDVDDGRFELVEPRYNRLVVFDAALIHEVLPVTAGRRYSMGINVWDYQIAHPSGRVPDGRAMLDAPARE